MIICFKQRGEKLCDSKGKYWSYYGMYESGN